MAQLYMYICFLSALGTVTVMTLTTYGRVGGNVTFKCSNWNVWSNVKHNVKYFCRSPCSYDTQIIVKAKYKEAKRKNRVEIVNYEGGLSVTFFNLQKSDSGKYYCGVERNGPDAYIEVDLTVMDAQPSSPKTTPITVSIDTTSSSASTNGSTVFTDTPPSNETLNMTISVTSPSNGPGSVPYLVIGGIVAITSLIVLLKIMRNMKKKQERVVSGARTPQEDGEIVEYDEIRHEDQPAVRQSQSLSSLYDSADPHSVYANCSSQQYSEFEAQGDDNMYSNDTYLNQASSSRVNSKNAFSKNRVADQQRDCLYSVAQPPKQRIKPAGQSELNRSKGNENDCLYSLAQLPQTT